MRSKLFVWTATLITFCICLFSLKPKLIWLNVLFSLLPSREANYVQVVQTCFEEICWYLELRECNSRLIHSYRGLFQHIPRSLMVSLKHSWLLVFPIYKAYHERNMLGKRESIGTSHTIKGCIFAVSFSNRSSHIFDSFEWREMRLICTVTTRFVRLEPSKKTT